MQIFRFLGPEKSKNLNLGASEKYYRFSNFGGSKNLKKSENLFFETFSDFLIIGAPENQGKLKNQFLATKKQIFEFSMIFDHGKNLKNSKI